jgi:hypothetical protein
VIDNFPILVDSGISFSIATLGPCGVFFPHIHPRATEVFVVIEGELDFGMMPEVSLTSTAPGAPAPPGGPAPIPQVNGTLAKYHGTVFPQGSIHWQTNNKCKPATIAAGLSSEDPGTNAVLNQVDGGSMMVKGKRQADFSNIENYFPVLPPAIVDAAKQCIARCSS